MNAVELSGNIHHFFAENGQVTLDDEGEPMIGFYYEIMRGSVPISALTGPYNSGPEAEAACQRAVTTGDY